MVLGEPAVVRQPAVLPGLTGAVDVAMGWVGSLKDMSDEVMVAEVPGTSWIETAPANPVAYYRVAGVDCLGVEGP